MTTFYFEGILYTYYPPTKETNTCDPCVFSKECNSLKDDLFCVFYNFPNCRVPGAYYKRNAIGTLLEEIK